MAISSTPEQDSTAASIEAMREVWGSAAPAWERWENYFTASSWPVSMRLMLSLGFRPRMRVLDVGCGIGDPSLQIATAIAPSGRVLGLDLAAEMIEVAKSRAQALGINNVEFRTGAVEDLSDSDRRFHAIVSRFTIFLFLDLPAGLRKLRNLLRPGGRLAVSVWASMDQNPMFRIPSVELAKYVNQPKPPPDAPGPMRLSKPGELRQALEEAGLTEVEVVDVPFYNFAKTPDEYFTMLYETAPHFRKAFDSLSEDHRRRVRDGVTAGVAQYGKRGVIRVPAVARVGVGVRPPRHEDATE